MMLEEGEGQKSLQMAFSIMKNLLAEKLRKIEQRLRQGVADTGESPPTD